MWIVTKKLRFEFGNYSWQISLFCFSMYVSNFDLKYLGVILICAANMHDFLQIFLQCLNLDFGCMSHGDMQKLHVTWSVSLAGGGRQACRQSLRRQPPRQPAARASGGMARSCRQRLTVARLLTCHHSLRRHVPRVAWGRCRHSRGGLFCQLHSQVVIFINELGRVVSFAKISDIYIYGGKLGVLRCLYNPSLSQIFRRAICWTFHYRERKMGVQGVQNIHLVYVEGPLR
jgi:hypothetical protein